MKKIILLALVALGMLACSDKNSPDGALTGTFRINDEKQSVSFSQGNLQYKPSTKTWRFAENQYDTIGAANSNISDSYDGWLDLFGYGTGDNPTQSSSDAKDYANFVDWGVNKISNGGNKSNQWRTLTMEEWGYVLFDRPKAASLRSLATVNNVHGVILLPDQFKQPSGLEWQADAANYDINIYPLNQWIKMEQAGAVFLPAAGMRYGKECDYGNVRGFYWSSSPTKYDDTEANGPYFDDKEKIDWYAYPRRFGQSVRLVQEL